MLKAPRKISRYQKVELYRGRYSSVTAIQSNVEKLFKIRNEQVNEITLQNYVNSKLLI